MVSINTSNKRGQGDRYLVPFKLEFVKVLATVQGLKGGYQFP